MSTGAGGTVSEKRYKVRQVGFVDLARDVAYVVVDTEAEVNATVAVFSESRYGPEAKRLAMKRRDDLNGGAGARRCL